MLPTGIIAFLALAAFACFGSLACILGIGRGAFEAEMGLGPELKDLFNQNLDIKYLVDSPEVRRRGILRIGVCSAAIPVVG